MAIGLSIPLNDDIRAGADSPAKLHKQSAAKSWTIFDTNSGAPVEADSFNVSNYIDNGTGNYSVDHTNSFTLAKRVCLGSSQSSFNRATYSLSASRTQILVSSNSFVPVDDVNISILCHGDLA